MRYLKNLLLTISSFLLFSEYIFCQKSIEKAGIDVDYINSKFSFEPCDQILPKNTLCRYKHKILTTYISSAEAEQVLQNNFRPFPTKFTFGNDAEYVFEMVFKLESLKKGEDDVSEKQIEIPGSPSQKVQVFKRRYDVFFSDSLNIYKKFDNNTYLIYKQIVVNNGTKPMSILLDKSEMLGQPNTYFSTVREMNELTNEEIGHVFEKRALRYSHNKMYSIMDALFKQVSYKESGMLGYIKKKKRKNDYSDFDKAFEDYKMAMKASINNNVQLSDSLISSATQTFETLLMSTEARIDDNVKLVTKIDLAWCYYWRKDYAKSSMLIEQAGKTLKEWNFNENTIESLNIRIFESKLRFALKEKLCDITNL